MVIHLHDHPLGISQHLSNLFDGDHWYLVAEVGAVIMPKYMSGEICYRLLRDRLHGSNDTCPHLIITALCDWLTIAHDKELTTLQGLDISLNDRKNYSRYGDSTIPVVRLWTFGYRLVIYKSYSFVDGQCAPFEVYIKFGEGQGFSTSETASI